MRARHRPAHARRTAERWAAFLLPHLRPGMRLLDLGCGPGSITAGLAAGLRAVGVDRDPVAIETVPVAAADAAALPFPDASFDAVVSTFGVMFTADQDKAAAELVRVCKPGGKIGLANWTPDGFIGQVFKTIGKHMPPPAGVKSPALWGTGARITELFGAQASSIQFEQREFVFRYRSAQHWLDVFKTYYGPLLKTFGAIDPKVQTALTEDLFALIKRFNRSGDATMVVPSEYIEVVVTRRA